MKTLHNAVQKHWNQLIPESALPPISKQGTVGIELAITKEGKIQGMKLITSSGDAALDRAAWGAILDTQPLPQLPAEFHGNYLKLRTHFYYNPERHSVN